MGRGWCKEVEVKNRNRQRENRRKSHQEMLSKYNAYGFKDLTAYNAVKRMKDKNDTTIVLQ